MGEFIDALQTAPAVLEAADYAAMQKSVYLVEGEAKALVPRRTGRLFSSITGEASVVEGRVGTNVEYAPFVEFGTEPHDIAAVNAMALVFEMNGQRVFRSRVHHPGARERAYLGPALERSKDAIVSFFKDAAAKLTEHLAGK